MPWFVVQTKPGREQWEVARQAIAAEGLEVFAPLCCEADGAGRRSKQPKVSVMFPFYLMVWKPSRNAGWLDVDHAWGVHRVLRLDWRVPPQPLADGVVEELQGMANAAGVIELAPRFKSGQGLRIVSGIFTGYEGIVSRKAGSRIWALLRFMGDQREVELSEADVEPLGAAVAQAAA